MLDVLLDRDDVRFLNLERPATCQRNDSYKARHQPKTKFMPACQVHTATIRNARVQSTHAQLYTTVKRKQNSKKSGDTIIVGGACYFRGLIMRSTAEITECGVKLPDADGYSYCTKLFAQCCWCCLAGVMLCTMYSTASGHLFAALALSSARIWIKLIWARVV